MINGMEDFGMLSVHEIATLMVAASRPDQIETDCEDFRALLHKGLADVEPITPGYSHVSVSITGQQMIRRLYAHDRKHTGSGLPRSRVSPV